MAEYKDPGHLGYIITCKRKGGPAFEKSYSKDQAVQVFLDKTAADQTLSEFDPELIDCFEVKPVVAHILNHDPDDDDPRTSDDLFHLCVQNGADGAAVAAWPDFKRREFIANPTA